jgi:hypothetical protein
MIKKRSYLCRPRIQRLAATYSHVIHSQLHSKRGQVKTVAKQLFAATLCRALRACEYCFPQFQKTFITGIKKRPDVDASGRFLCTQPFSGRRDKRYAPPR